MPKQFNPLLRKLSAVKDSLAAQSQYAYGYLKNNCKNSYHYIIYRDFNTMSDLKLEQLTTLGTKQNESETKSFAQKSTWLKPILRLLVIHILVSMPMMKLAAPFLPDHMLIDFIISCATMGLVTLPTFMLQKILLSASHKNHTPVLVEWQRLRHHMSLIWQMSPQASPELLLKAEAGRDLPSMIDLTIANEFKDPEIVKFLMKSPSERASWNLISWMILGPGSELALKTQTNQKLLEEFCNTNKIINHAQKLSLAKKRRHKITQEISLATKLDHNSSSFIADYVDDRLSLAYPSEVLHAKIDETYRELNNKRYG